MNNSVVVAFDLRSADEAAYKAAHKYLVERGFSALSPNKSLRLPDTTFLGSSNVMSENATTTRDLLMSGLANATGCEVSRLLVATVSDWACHGNRDLAAALGEILIRIES